MTKASALRGIIKAAKQAHSCTAPGVIALPIIGGNEDYSKWVKEEVKAS